MTAWTSGIGSGVLVFIVLSLVFSRPAPTPELSVGDDPVLGNSTAPIVVYYFADFQCPSCRRFEVDGTMDRFRSEYVDTGKAKLVFKDFPIVGDDSWTAAQASQSVWGSAPAIYWQWHQGLFQVQGPERSGWASIDHIVEYSARFPEVNMTALRSSLARDAYRGEVSQDKADGAAHGVQGTPTVIVDGRVVNPHQYDELKAAIEE
ncbi:MAG: thioredoxin domain-containing protein, partial [Candidatus Thermoplasmatota archaeon]